MYRVTEEGQRYLELGLPERRLLDILDKPLEIKEASERLVDFAIAMQWAKKWGWVEVKEGKLHIKDKPENIPLEIALKKVSKKEDADEDLIKVLISRKLITEIRDDILKRAKKLVGTEITELKEELISTGLWSEVKFKPYNVEAHGKRIHPGKRQPYQRFVTGMKHKLVELGFKEVTGPLIETEFWNFDALFQPQNHPARDWTSTYQLKHPKRGLLPDEK